MACGTHVWYYYYYYDDVVLPCEAAGENGSPILEKDSYINIFTFIGVGQWPFFWHIYICISTWPTATVNIPR